MYLDKNDEVSESMCVLRDRIKYWNKKLKYPLGELETFGKCFEYYVEKLRFFTLSFSLSEDDPELWKRFGGKKNGFAIRLDKGYLEEKPYSWDRNIPFNGIMKVSYGKETLYKLADSVSKILIHLDKVDDPKKYQECIIDVYSKLIPQLPKTLNECYVIENEYRLYTQDIGISEDLRISDDLIFYDNEYNPYLLSDPFSLMHVREILIGANNNLEATKEKIYSKLRRYFSQEELNNIIIKKSGIRNNLLCEDYHGK